MKVVSDSGPLIHLSRINKIEILRQFFGEIYIPSSVYHELTLTEEVLPGCREIETYKWIKKKEIHDHTAKALLMEYLDAGESEAILLAKEVDADLLLIDDLAGRRGAITQNIPVMGTLGVLDRAYKEGKISDLKDVIDELRDKGFWMDDDLYKMLVKD